MRVSLLAGLVMVMTLTACGSAVRESRYNPRNWFGGASNTEPTLGPTSAYTDNRALVPQVTDLVVDRAAGGAIVRATGLAPTQGWWDAELVPETTGIPLDGVMRYRFVIAQPESPQRQGAPRSRQIVVAAVIQNRVLDFVDRIEVVGAQNTRSTRR
jgi:hypothetical protein